MYLYWEISSRLSNFHKRTDRNKLLNQDSQLTHLSAVTPPKIASRKTFVCQGSQIFVSKLEFGKEMFCKYFLCLTHWHTLGNTMECNPLSSLDRPPAYIQRCTRTDDDDDYHIGDNNDGELVIISCSAKGPYMHSCLKEPPEEIYNLIFMLLT